MSKGSVAYTLQSQRERAPITAGSSVLPNRGGPRPSSFDSTQQQKSTGASDNTNTGNNNGNKNSSDKEKLKLVVRYLPPNIDESWLMGLMRTWVNDNTLQTYYFVQGHVSRKGAIAKRQLKLEQQRYGSVRVSSSTGRSDSDIETKPDIYSRLYLTMKSHGDLTRLVKEFNRSVVPTIILQEEQDMEEESGEYNMTDLDSSSSGKRGTDDMERKKKKCIVRPTIEYAPFQGKLKVSKPHPDAGTFEKDEGYLKFLQELEKDNKEKMQAKEKALKEQEAKENGKRAGEIVLKLDPNAPTMVSQQTLIAAGVIPKETEKEDSKADKKGRKDKAGSDKKDEKRGDKTKDGKSKEKKDGKKGERDGKKSEKDGKEKDKDGKPKKVRKKKKEGEEGTKSQAEGGDKKKKKILERPGDKKERGGKPPIENLTRNKGGERNGSEKSTSEATGGKRILNKPSSADGDVKIPRQPGAAANNSHSGLAGLNGIPSGPKSSPGSLGSSGAPGTPRGSAPGVSGTSGATDSAKMASDNPKAESRPATPGKAPTSAQSQSSLASDGSKPETSESNKSVNSEKRKRRRNRGKKEGESEGGSRPLSSKGTDEKSKPKGNKDEKKKEPKEKTGEAPVIPTGPNSISTSTGSASTNNNTSHNTEGAIPTAPSGGQGAANLDKKKRGSRSRNGAKKTGDGTEKPEGKAVDGQSQQQPPRGPRGKRSRSGKPVAAAAGVSQGSSENAK